MVLSRRAIVTVQSRAVLRAMLQDATVGTSGGCGSGCPCVGQRATSLHELVHRQQQRPIICVELGGYLDGVLHLAPNTESPSGECVLWDVVDLAELVDRDPVEGSAPLDCADVRL